MGKINLTEASGITPELMQKLNEQYNSSQLRAAQTKLTNTSRDLRNLSSGHQMGRGLISRLGDYLSVEQRELLTQAAQLLESVNSHVEHAKEKRVRDEKAAKRRQGARNARAKQLIAAAYPMPISPDLASYAYSALHLQLVSARRQHVSQLKRCNPTTKRRRGRIFAEAWIDAVANNVYKFAGRLNAETQQAISAYLSLHHPTVIEKELESTSVKGHDLRSQHQGWMQGSKAPLHRGVDQHSPSPARIGRA